MSLIGDRASLAAALSGADGVTGFSYRPTTPLPGDAWPLLSSLERADGLTFTAEWRVLVFLPQDERAASAWIDTHIEGLVDALEPQAFVDRIEPVTIGPGSAEQYVLQITVRGE